MEASWRWQGGEDGAGIVPPGHKMGIWLWGFQEWPKENSKIYQDFSTFCRPGLPGLLQANELLGWYCHDLRLKFGMLSISWNCLKVLIHSKSTCMGKTIYIYIITTAQITIFVVWLPLPNLGGLWHCFNHITIKHFIRTFRSIHFRNSRTFRSTFSPRCTSMDHPLHSVGSSHSSSSMACMRNHAV